MTSPITIPQRSAAVSTSPVHSLLSERFAKSAGRTLHPVEKDGMRLLVLENISRDAVNAFKAQGFHVDHHVKAFSEDELVAVIGSYHGIGIRSKTRITAKVLKAATNVCFHLPMAI